ncbi:hypothetical protein BCR43DRAFT_484542 [Syncephalastrum racemosum]|uniref:Uncharacterized protein n=1 Tax=Syncephalastrum racemosum TaxID=13706 RepID=A0A1X2HKV2_SYNRA|nr:hypothetical protein BCR43DRAFT_484542 [Syncephalastrum racemosum]
MSTKATGLFDHLPAPRTVFTYTRKRFTPVTLEDDSDDEQPPMKPTATIGGTASQNPVSADLVNSTIQMNHVGTDNVVLVDSLLQNSRPFQTSDTSVLQPLEDTPLDSMPNLEKIPGETDIDGQSNADCTSPATSSDISQDDSMGENNIINNDRDTLISGTVAPLDIFAFPDEPIPPPTASPAKHPLPTRPTKDQELSRPAPSLVDASTTNDIFDFPDNDSSSDSDEEEQNLNWTSTTRQIQADLKPCITMPSRPRLKKSVTFSKQTVVATFKRGTRSSDHSPSFFEPMMAPHESDDMILDTDHVSSLASKSQCRSITSSFNLPTAATGAQGNARPKRSLVSRLKSARGEDVSEGPGRDYNFEEIEEEEEGDGPEPQNALQTTDSRTPSESYPFPSELLMNDVPRQQQDENQHDGDEQTSELTKRRKVYRPENPIRVQVTYKRERHTGLSAADDDELAQLDNLLLSLKRTNSA